VSELSTAQHGLNERATDPSVPIREWVDCFELSVSDRGLGEQGKVVALNEGDEIVHELEDSIVMRWYKLCGVGPKAPSPDPDLLVTPVTDNFWVTVLEEYAMHFQDGASVDGLGQCQGRLHRSDVADD